MIRYVLSVLVFLAGIVLTISAVGGGVLIYVDIPGCIIAVIVPFLFTGVVCGFTEMRSAFSAALGKEREKETLLKALHFFKVYGKATWIAGYIAVLIGVIAMLVNLEDKTAIGPNLALALTAMLYSGIIQVIVILPLRAFIHKRLILAGTNSPA
ncbi:MAG: hypothetical protein LBK62_02575 [Treponema sp.]|jgi:hypothetical protein|nr:hypothetical protein [Treponema sp.]